MCLYKGTVPNIRFWGELLRKYEDKCTTKKHVKQNNLNKIKVNNLQRNAPVTNMSEYLLNI